MNIQRDSYASYIGHYPILAYFAIAENESIGRERYNFMQVTLSLTLILIFFFFQKKKYILPKLLLEEMDNGWENDQLELDVLFCKFKETKVRKTFIWFTWIILLRWTSIIAQIRWNFFFKCKSKVLQGKRRGNDWFWNMQECLMTKLWASKILNCSFSTQLKKRNLRRTT